MQFVRVCSNTDPVLIYKMLTEDWGLSPPHLVVALVGGDELAQMKPWLRDTLRKGLVKAAQSTGYNQWAKAGLDFSQQGNSLCLAFCCNVAELLSAIPLQYIFVNDVSILNQFSYLFLFMLLCTMKSCIIHF